LKRNAEQRGLRAVAAGGCNTALGEGDAAALIRKSRPKVQMKRHRLPQVAPPDCSPA
jgi:hypothetical protein